MRAFVQFVIASLAMNILAALYVLGTGDVPTRTLESVAFSFMIDMGLLAYGLIVIMKE